MLPFVHPKWLLDQTNYKGVLHHQVPLALQLSIENIAPGATRQSGRELHSWWERVKSCQWVFREKWAVSWMSDTVRNYGTHFGVEWRSKFKSQYYAVDTPRQRCLYLAMHYSACGLILGMLLAFIHSQTM